MPSQRCKGFKVFKGLERFKVLQAADLDAHQKPLMCALGVLGCQSGQKKPLMCGLAVAVGCRMKHAKSTF